jgi:hypothetical protein
LKYFKHLAAVILVLMACQPGLAQNSVTTNATITVNAGTLNVASTGDLTFSALTLDGTNQTATCSGTPTLTITDARGTGGGWNVTLQLTTAFTSGSNTIAASNLSCTATGGTVTPSAGSGANPTQPGTTGTLDSALKVLSAANSGTAGMGRYQFAPATSQFNLTVPAATFAGSYTGTLTITLGTGP